MSNQVNDASHGEELWPDLAFLQEKFEVVEVGCALGRLVLGRPNGTHELYKRCKPAKYRPTSFSKIWAHGRWWYLHTRDDKIIEKELVLIGIAQRSR